MNQSHHPTRFAVAITFAGLFLWVAIVTTGTRLPYIYTAFATQVRTFVVFPLLLGGLIYRIYFYRRPGQPSGFEWRMSLLSSRGERLKAGLIGVVGLFLVSGGIAWTSVAFPAWATKLFATDVVVHQYVVHEITRRSGPEWSTLFDLELTDARSGESVVLRLPRAQFELNRRWKPGDSICVRGRKSLFGTIVDSTSRDERSCNGGA